MYRNGDYRLAYRDERPEIEEIEEVEVEIIEPILPDGYTDKIIFNNKVMVFDHRFKFSARGIIKIIQIFICFISMLLVGLSQPYHDERGLAFLATTIGILIAFTLLVCYTVMLNTRFDAYAWLMGEAIYDLLMVIAFIVAGIFMFWFNAFHWADMNPAWQYAPAFASGSLFACALVYSIEAVLLCTGWQRYSWKPTFDYTPKNSQLPH
ncbi:unnamed protein product, partial [Mesorhabditis spiculigera]